MALIPIDGAPPGAGGQVLRTALALSAATGQGFSMTRIREKALRPGLHPHHVAAVRAAALVCSARVHGAFDGSPDLRFEPGPPAGGEFHFEIGGAGAATLVLQLVVPALAAAAPASRVEAAGGTHVPASPTFEYLSRHWAAVMARLGLDVTATLERAGYAPRGDGLIVATVAPWRRPASLALEERGALVVVRGVSTSGRLKGDVARRQRDAAQALFWERRRLEAEWEVAEVDAGGPGASLLVEAVFEGGRAAFGYLAEGGVASERLGERAARRLLRFLEDEEGAVDPHLADQLAVPMALAGGGGRVTTPEVTRHLETVAGVLGRFGFSARAWGRRGGPGGLEVGRC